MATVSIKNTSKIAPLWYRKLKKVVNIGIVPSTVLTIKGLWVGSDAELNRILIIITVSIPAIIEIVGMLLADPDDTDTQTVTTEGTQAPTVNVTTTPKTP